MINGDNIAILKPGLYKTRGKTTEAVKIFLAARKKYKYRVNDFLYPGARWFFLTAFFLAKKKAPDKLKT